MKPWRVTCISVLLGALLVGCTDSRISGGNSTTSAATTTSAGPPTTQPPATTSTSTTVPESTTSTTSTIPAVLGLDLSADGIGEESFGAEANGVIAYVESIIGSPTHDTGWFATDGLACVGTEIRYVTWGDLALGFGDESPYGSGLRHFTSYSYGPPAGAFVDPFGLSVAGGVSIGDTVDELLAAYPDAVISSDAQLDASMFNIVDALSGFLTGTTGADTITSFLGGFVCGE